MKSLRALSRETGLSYNTVKARIREGWDTATIAEWYRTHKRHNAPRVIKSEKVMAQQWKAQLEATSGKGILLTLKEAGAEGESARVVAKRLGLTVKQLSIVVRWCAPSLIGLMERNDDTD